MTDYAAIAKEAERVSTGRKWPRAWADEFDAERTGQWNGVWVQCPGDEAAEAVCAAHGLTPQGDAGFGRVWAR
jgi:hypothetical protein